jgi:hypothetical protein
MVMSNYCGYYLMTAYPLRSIAFTVEKKLLTGTIDALCPLMLLCVDLRQKA